MKINKKNIWIIILLIYFILPANIALKESDIDKSKNYLIVKMYMSTDIDYKVLYDSIGRNISYIKDDCRIKNFFLNFSGFKNDELGNLNTYVIYTDDNTIEYFETYSILHIENYKIRIIYPVKRDLFNNIYPKWWVFKFEQWI